MKFGIVVFFIMFYSVLASQEIGSIEKGEHFVKLYKSDNLYSFKYSDIKPKSLKKEYSFSFSNKQHFYSILINGFNNAKGHQIILKTANDTIVKLNYKNIKGELLLFVYQNNLIEKSSGRSTFFSKAQIIELFEGENLRIEVSQN
ncbi:hypothetical protein [uncultured Lutibacter sp.]|uniref:hypothetical protein n=1 Tax=uncultured Lutibacter sp. TaxID=437739 RepID=UPI002633D4E1|nr:hypothetical protein [uncultured Lutibacter sp.]